MFSMILSLSLRRKTSLSSSLAAGRPRIIAAATRSTTAARPSLIAASAARPVSIATATTCPALIADAAALSSHSYSPPIDHPRL